MKVLVKGRGQLLLQPRCVVQRYLGVKVVVLTIQSSHQGLLEEKGCLQELSTEKYC